jgi:hypothetical protein
MLGIYRVAAQLVASGVVLSSTELVSYTFWYVSYVRTSQETRVCAFAAYYGDSFTLLLLFC